MLVGEFALNGFASVRFVDFAAFSGWIWGVFFLGGILLWTTLLGFGVILLF